jgi:hypothetical protein
MPRARNFWHTFGNRKASLTKSSVCISRWRTSESVVTIMLTHAGGPRTRAPSHDSLLPNTRAARIRYRRASPLGREGLAILALRKLHRQSSFCGAGPARDRWQPWKAAHGICSPLPGSITSAQARHALTACGSARAGEGGVRREPRPSLSVNPSTPCC